MGMTRLFSDENELFENLLNSSWENKSTDSITLISLIAIFDYNSPLLPLFQDASFTPATHSNRNQRAYALLGYERTWQSVEKFSRLEHSLGKLKVNHNNYKTL